MYIYKLGLEKAEDPEIKLPAFIGSKKKQESSRQTSISTLLYGDLCNIIETRTHLTYAPGRLTYTKLLRQSLNIHVVVSYTIYPFDGGALPTAIAQL